MSEQINRLKRLILRFSVRYRAQFALSGLLLIGFFLGFTLLYQRPYVFQFGSTNCFRDITVLPSLHKTAKTGEYNLHKEGIRSVGPVQLLSTRTCVDPQKSPQEFTVHSASYKVLGVSMPGKKFLVRTGALPKLASRVTVKRISVRDPIILSLDQVDTTFGYTIETNMKSAPCVAANKQLSCGMERLGLDQNKDYVLKLTRTFQKKKQDSLMRQTFRTTDPVIITGGTVSRGAIIYEIPTSLTVETNKGLASADIVLSQTENGKQQVVPTTVSVQDKKVTIALKSPLPRRKNFVLKINDLTSTDKGLLLAPEVFEFTTSGGPKVTGVNIGSKSVDRGKTIVVLFDQNLQPDVSVASKVTVTVRGVPTSVSATVSGNAVVIKPQTDWGLCAPFSIKLSGDIPSNYGISGDSSWQIGSRVVCYSVGSIGTSAQGRPINAWSFGSGPTRVLFLGATHGDERSTKYLMDEWITELEANPDRLPTQLTIVVVPVVNPDGFESKSRFNARNVDLNRNFPANDWKSDVTVPGGSMLLGGGGSSPLSEPESSSLASLVISQRPSLVLTYHSVAAVVSGNDSGDSNILAQAYASQSGYRYLPVSDTNEVFQYDTTGAFEDWLHDKLGVPGILVELGSSTKSQFSNNREAMWKILSNL